MRWRNAFMAEVAQTLVQLGIRPCPVCGAVRSLTMSPFPVLLVDAGIPGHADSGSDRPDHDGDVTFAVRLECASCGLLLLLNAQKYRSADEKILVADLTDEHERQLGE